MAQIRSMSADVQDIQFKLQNKYKLFGQNFTLRSHLNLLAVASSKGLAFVGNPSANCFQALLLHNVTEANIVENSLSIRKVPLPNVPNVMSCNADNSMLAINYTLSDYGAVTIYKVPSFTSSNITCLYNIRLPSPETVSALQLLWNPVNSASLAVVLSNGSFVVYTLNEGGVFEMRCLDKTHQVKCGCWSPKGKQLVLGFQGGTLKQFKPDLTTVKTIACPPVVHPSPFDTIAVHWLSTFQFAVVFLQRLENASPSLYIVNSPKGVNPEYIHYNDICYSSPGPREHQFMFTHIQQWKLLLVTSANGIEVGVLGTKECTDLPTWLHYTLLDEARIEMPLTDDSDETYPIGIGIDTSTTHQLVIGENKLPAMPMVHVLTTHGQLLCFNFLNLSAGAIKLCSVPQQSIYIVSEPFPSEKVAPNHGYKDAIFKQNKQDINIASRKSPIPESSDLNASNMIDKNKTVLLEKEKPVRTTVCSTSNKSSHLTSQEFIEKDKRQFDGQNFIENNKPLYTLPPTFKLSSTRKPVQKEAISKEVSMAQSIEHNLDTEEINAIVQEIIAMHIITFDKEVKELTTKYEERLITVDDFNTIKLYYVRLINLEDVIERANERDFLLDMQDLHHSYNEVYKMITECRTKLDTYKNPDGENLRIVSVFDCVSQRQISNLKSYLAIIESLVQQFRVKIDSQWAIYQDLIRRSTKTQIRIPCLDGMFLHLTKFKVLVMQQRTKLNYLKAALKLRNLSFRQIEEICMNTKPVKTEVTMGSLADNLLSINLHHNKTIFFKMPLKKLEAMLDFSRNQRKIPITKAHRPLRVELTSEIILESKVLNRRKGCVDLQKISVKLSEQSHMKSKDSKVEGLSAYKLQPIPGKTTVPIKPTIVFSNTSPLTKTDSTQNEKSGVGIKPLTVATNQIDSDDTNFSKAQSLSFMEAKAVRPNFEEVIKIVSEPQISTPILFSPKVIGGDVIKKSSSTINEFVATSPHLKPMLPYKNNHISQQTHNKFSVGASISNIGKNAPTTQLKIVDKPHDNSAVTTSLPTSIVDSRVLDVTSLTEFHQNIPENRDIVTAKSSVSASFLVNDSVDKFIETTSEPVQQTTGLGNGTYTNTNIPHEDKGSVGAAARIPTIASTTTPLAVSMFRTLAPTSVSFASSDISSVSDGASVTSTLIVSTPSELKAAAFNRGSFTETTTSCHLFKIVNSTSVANCETFGVIPKSEHITCANPVTTKSNPTTNTLHTAVAESKSPVFGSAALGISTFGDIFDGNGSNLAGTNSNPVFVAASYTSPVDSGTNNAHTSTLADSSSTKITESTNVFCLSAQSNVISGGSMFGDNAFTKPEENIFASALYPSKKTNPNAAELNLSSSFSDNTATSSAGTRSYLFGGPATETTDFTSASTNVFSTNTQPDTVQPFSSFGQGVSVAHVGFGSSSQQSGPLKKPIFGGASEFGSPPTFGMQPNFGGTLPFGLPKELSSFETPNANPAMAFNSNAQKNNIFETLGMADTSLSFGNLAQATNSPSTSKPAFGGLSFMNYRA